MSKSNPPLTNPGYGPGAKVAAIATSLNKIIKLSNKGSDLNERLKDIVMHLSISCPTPPPTHTPQVGI